MDIKNKIEEVVAKVKDDKDFASKFSKDPVKALESIIGVDLPDDQVSRIIEGVKAKIAVGNAGGLFNKVKKLF